MIDILVTILMSSVKFAVTFPLAVMEFRFNFFETILWTNTGGALGIFFFAYLSEYINSWLEKKLKSRRIKRYRSQSNEKRKKVFTKRNRRMVRIKQKYGLIGISLTTPVIFSIPVGVFLVVRYYSNVRTRFLYLMGANLFWSVIYTFIYMFWDGILFRR